MQFLSGILNILDQKERIRLFLLIFLDVLISALDVTFLGFTIFVINFYIKGAGSHYLSWLPHFLSDKNSLYLMILFFIVFGIKNVFAYLVQSANLKFIYKIASRLSERNIRQYLRDDYIQFVHVDSAAHIRKISQQPIEFSNYILVNFQQIISHGLLVLFTVVAILLYHAGLFLLLLILLMPAVILLGWLLKKRLRNVRSHIKETNEATLKNLKEALGGYIESNIYGKEDFFAERYFSRQQQMNGHISTQQTLQALPSRLIEVFAILGFLILIAINKWSGHTPAVDLLTIGIFMAAAYKIIPGMVKILNSAGQMKTYEFVLHDLTNNEAVVSIQNEQAEPIRSISLEKLYFKYSDRPVLEGVSFEISPGDFIGLSGNSGKGKTTLIHILLGFIEQQNGSVGINHKIATRQARKAYRNRISYIKQQPFFIHDSVEKNITLQDGDYDETKLNEVITFCGIDAMLSPYPEGSGFIITENGRNLSGGQRQRIMLARALYHGFDLLILDEPFGEMDQASEYAILNQLKLLAELGKMILFITHNKASLSFCNRIISLDE